MMDACESTCLEVGCHSHEGAHCCLCSWKNACSLGGLLGVRSLLQLVSICDSPSDPGLFQPSRPALHDVLHPQRPHLVSIASVAMQLSES